MELWELIARESIRDLVTRYNSNGDSGRFNEVMALFADNAIMEVEGEAGPVVHRGHAEIRTIFTGTQERWAEERGAGVHVSDAHYVRHRVATHQIDFDNDTHARGYSYYEVLMPHGLDHWGRYFDRYERRGDKWIFTYRKATREGRVGLT
jgi:hypothetical protein|tara:strand:+ start:642 stop:1091 length:450 start_codon:yes stop_codon:yes gene_type:complete